MKKHDPSEFDGFEKKPEAEWTARDRKLLEVYGVVPLTEAGKKAFGEHLDKTSPRLKKFRSVLAQCVGETVPEAEETEGGAE